MICEKCGKNNPSKNTICSSCKAPLPVSESCGGFADILTFSNVPGPVTVEETKAAGMNDADARHLIKKTSAIAEYNQKITLFTLIGAGISTLLLILAIVFFIITSVKVSLLERKFDDLKESNDSEQISADDDIKLTTAPNDSDNQNYSELTVTDGNVHKNDNVEEKVEDKQQQEANQVDMEDDEDEDEGVNDSPQQEKSLSSGNE